MGALWAHNNGPGIDIWFRRTSGPCKQQLERLEMQTQQDPNYF